MINAKDFWDYLEKKGFSYFSGVPCSILEPVLRELPQRKSLTYVPAVRENVALGIVSGALIAGKNSAILMQNSGIGNIINALTSFNLIYKIPVLMFVTWRGYQGKDAPEHIIMGQKSIDLLNTVGIPSIILSQDFKTELDQAIKIMNNEKIPVAVIIRKDLFVEKV